MILDTLADSTRKRVERKKQQVPLELVKKTALSMPVSSAFPFEAALKTPGMSFICEVKRASPSKGIIAEHFPYLDIAKEYERAGASAISVLTEPEYFKGDDRYLSEIAAKVSVPILRKDFTVDPYQIYEAKVLGASAVLLICALLNTRTIREWIEIGKELGLSALAEAHNERELDAALEAGAEIIGVNNRDLKTFQVDLETSLRLRELVPKDRVFVAESGIHTPQDVRLLQQSGVDAILVGEALMKSPDKKAMLDALRGQQ
jgi:indole-3-glycerol phosphate synthase